MSKKPHEMTPEELKALPEAPRDRFLFSDVASKDAIHSWQDSTGRWQPVTDGQSWYKQRLMF